MSDYVPTNVTLYVGSRPRPNVRLRVLGWLTDPGPVGAPTATNADCYTNEDGVLYVPPSWSGYSGWVLCFARDGYNPKASLVFGGSCTIP